MTATPQAAISHSTPSPRIKNLSAKLALAVACPLAFFVLLESGLRIGGFGLSCDFFVPDEQAGVYRTNPHFTELFFPASFGLTPVNFRLSREKTAGSCRIFVVGESAAMGVPEPAFAIAPQLQAQLRAAEPDRPIEVYNLGITAINSHAILRIVRQAVEFHPDLLVIYMGNNEVVGPYGPGSIVSGGLLPRWLIRLALWVRSMRTGQLVQRALGALHAAGGEFKDWRGMEMFAQNMVAADDPRLAGVYANFAANLDDVLALARVAGVKVVLSTVAVNVRDCAPFASQHRSDLAPAQLAIWQQCVDRATLAADLGTPDEVRHLLQQALAIDPRYADTHFRLARALEAGGDLPNARAHYLEALQLDALRFRADARINAIIREAAGRHPPTVTLVDAAKELGSDEASSILPAGADLLFEHVHFRWKGSAALARLLAPVAWRALHHEHGLPVPAWLDSMACAKAVGYTELGRLTMAQRMRELTDRPPFTGQSSFGENRAQLLGEIAGAKAALATREAVAAAAAKLDVALQNDPRNLQLLFQAATARLQTEDFAGAVALNDRLRVELPFSPEQAAQRAYLLQQLGRATEAEDVLLRSAAAAPFYFQTYSLLARLWAATGQTAKALGFFEKLVQRMPGCRGARNDYANLLAHSGNWPAAEREWRAVLRLVPDDESALAPLCRYLLENGRSEEAGELMLAAYAYNPRSFANNARLVRWHETNGDATARVKYMQALAASGPVNARLYSDLAFEFEKLGRREEMRIALMQARRAAADEGDEATLFNTEELLRKTAGEGKSR